MGWPDRCLVGMASAPGSPVRPGHPPQRANLSEAESESHSGLFQPDQFNFAFLISQAPQVHLHVIPRYASPRKWAGLTFRDDHWGSSFGSEQRRLPGELLQRLAAELKEP
jgi:diadenosine tetraphosphate (Ap4A) HIT family hydrolase